MSNLLYLVFLVNILVSGVYCSHKDVVCNGSKVWKRVVLNYGDRSRYYTPEDGNPGYKQTKCTGKYELGENCAAAVVRCYKFSTMSSKDCSSWGDYLAITDQQSYKRYCKEEGPFNFSPAGDFKMRFMTKRARKSAGLGLDCYVFCPKHKGEGKRVSWNTKPYQDTDCKCGMVKRSRIVGGNTTEINEYPWQAVVSGPSGGLCGGALISDQWVLTAAHCNPTTDSFVILGEHDITNSGEAEAYKWNVESVVSHGLYEFPYRYNYDYALIKLTIPVPFDRVSHIRPICLPVDDSQSYAGSTAVATGWGTTSSGGEISNILQEVELPVLSNYECRNMGYDPQFITEQMLCAGIEGKDSCQGDSGGGLVTRIPGSTLRNYVHIGVVSFGTGCGFSGYPGVYARTTKVLSWIEGATGESFRTCPMQ